MKAVAAARQWWATRRPRYRPQAGLQAIAPARAPAPPPIRQIARGSSVALVLLAAATITGAVIGLVVTQANDRRFAIERHAALQSALDELHAVFGDLHRFDDGQLRLIERRSGLKDLRFGTDPEPDSGREIQSLQDPQGRILGWFSWAPDRALILAMGWLWGLVGTVGVALAFFAVFTERATWRLARALAGSMETTHRLSSEDALTGLPNQRVMLESLERALGEREREGQGYVAVALVDLDNFREVNETLGRKGGDDVLRAIAQRLKSGLPEGAELGRFEDDAFAVIASGDANAGSMLIDALRASLAEPFAVEQASAGRTWVGQTWQISAGIGMAQAPEDGTTGEELTRRAALTLRAAKRDGHGTARRFSPQLESELSDRRFLLRELRAAISSQAFEVHYQPIVAAAGGAIIGVEALLRWTHATRGAITPSTFIPLAERYGLMKEVGEFVLRRALADAARWPNLSIAINLSPVQIRDPRFVALVGGVMAESGIAAPRVVLEMTEGVLIDDPEVTQTRLEGLRALGVSLALDDFGTGYSSLGYLQKFPFQRLKIDRGFVASLGAVGNAGAIIQSIVTLGHALGMMVLAEGVETDQQRVLLRLAGCDEMQGYLFSKALPADAIDKIVAKPALPRAANEQTAAIAS